MTTALWRRLDVPGMERCSLERTPEGFRIGGTVLVHLDASPHEIRYSILTDERWRTRTVGAHAQGPSADRRLALQSDGDGSWTVGGNPILDLFGATDVDLSWTPATNTLPIRRLNLAVGASADVSTTFVNFPGHDVARRMQRYTRIDEREFRFESGEFAANLFVDDEGLVTRYEGLWESVS